jgi:hypothetical protein
MNAFDQSTAPDYTQPESAAARRIREIRQSALYILAQALSHPFISEGQRALATAKAADCHDIWQLLKWHKAVVQYVADVKAGLREVQPEPAPAAAAPAPAPTVQPVAAVPLPRRQLRPARRMSAEKLLRLRAANQARRDAAEQLRTPTPMWTESPRLSALPGGLYWSGPAQVPAVGAAVMVSHPGGLSGKVTVAGYFHAEGFLGIVVDAEKVPAKLQHSPRSRFLFGSDVHALAA